MMRERNPFDSLLGQVVDGLVVLKQVGSGATGTVYQAMDTRHDNRLVALKVMNAIEQRLVSAQGGEGNPFEREMRFSRQVDDPGIVRVYGTGTLSDGRYYVSMELVGGMTLEEELRHRRLVPWPEACQLTVQLAASVASLHRLQIIHRDLKPSNVMVRVGKDGQVRTKLLDFGVAKLQHERDVAGTELAGAGTPRYMAPEQAAGLGSSRGSDVYALGAVLYELVTGQAPVVVPRPSAEAYREYLCGSGPIPMVPIRELQSELPDSIATVVERALSRQPRRRYGDAGLFGLALDQAWKSVKKAQPDAGGLAGRIKSFFRRQS